MKMYTKEELAQVLKLHGEYILGMSEGVRANLSSANLCDANLCDANLRGANLCDANLYDANLRGADLRGADLYDANLSGANLSGANLSGADLRGADLRGANLSGADLRGADLSTADLYMANLSGADLCGADLCGAVGNMWEVKSIQCEYWPVTYTATHMQIGCQRHDIAEWRGFTDEQIAGMDNHALEWWAVWKPILMSIIEVSPATPTGKEDE